MVQKIVEDDSKKPAQQFDFAAWWGPRNWVQWKDEVLAAIVVVFAQIPNSVAFANMAHCPPAVGLHAAWIVGLICALFGGRPGMVNGAAAALAATQGKMVKHVGGEYIGLENLFVAVIIAGIIVVLCAALRVGKFVTLVPATVMIGFCNGLAIVIGSAQVTWWKDPSDVWLSGQELTFTLIHSAIALVIMYSIPRLTKQAPASLICIIVGCLVEYCIFKPLGTPTETIKSKSNFDQHDRFPKPLWAYDLGTVSFSGDLMLNAVTLAVVAMLESLMCMEVVNDLTGTLGEANRQVWALGFANLLSGIMGTMGGNSLIELCVMNVQARGTLRASSTFIALGILCVVMFAAPALAALPSGTLGGIMITVVAGTARWSSIPAIVASVLPESFLQGDGKVKGYLRSVRIDVFDSVVIVLVTVLCCFPNGGNLMAAVGIGVALAAMRFSWQAQQPLQIEAVHSPESPGCKTYKIKGPLFYANKGTLTEAFDAENDPPLVQIDFKHAKVHDFSIVHSFRGIIERYANHQKDVQVVNLKDATHLQHLLYFGATKAAGGSQVGLSASFLSKSGVN